VRREQRAADPQVPEPEQTRAKDDPRDATQAKSSATRLAPLDSRALELPTDKHQHSDDAPPPTNSPSAPSERMSGASAEDHVHPAGETEHPISSLSTTGRRAAGALESAVLDVLWHGSAPMSPGEVREKLTRTDTTGTVLSYSTVVTILTRLHEKGSLSRERDGRAYRYAPVSDEAGLAARRLSQLLDRAPDREAVLSRFVADLSTQDEVLLRSLLGDTAAADSDSAPEPGRHPTPTPTHLTDDTNPAAPHAADDDEHE
jgi:predicted transcriptional regulator